VSERFFVDKSAPAFGFIGQTGFTSLFGNGREKIWRCGEIEEIIFGNIELFIQIFEQFLQILERLFVGEIAARVMRPLDEPVDQIFINVLADKFGQIGSDFRLKFLTRKFLPPDTDDGERIRQKILLRQIVERGEKFAFRQIARRAENNHRAGIGLFLYFAHK